MIIEAKVYQTVTLCLKLCQALHMHYPTGSPARAPTHKLFLFPTWTSGSAKVQRACKSPCPYNNLNKNLGNLKINHFLGNVRELRLKDKQLPQHIETQAHRESHCQTTYGAEATRTINWKEHLVVILMDR